MTNKSFLLFCFPFAGGTAEFYNSIEDACGENVKFIKFDYPGHGTRMKEPLCKNFFELTEDILPKILDILKTNPDKEYALMGYSMGSIALFDVFMKIMNMPEYRKPWRVFISAHQPQPISSLRNISEDCLDEWVKERTIEFGGIDEKLINNAIFWRMYLPIFRNDYMMIANYEFPGNLFQSDVPLTVFYSEEDTPYTDMLGWKQYFSGESEYIEYDGTHFFIDNHYKEMAKVINDEYKKYCEKKCEKK